MPAALLILGAVIVALYAIANSDAGGEGGDASSSLGASAVPPAPSAGAGTGLFAMLGQTLSALWSPPAKAAPYLDAIANAEATYGIPTNLLARQIKAESNFNPNAVSPVGAIGISQFMPATAAELGIDPTDPFASINAQGKYLRSLYDQTGSWISALAAYNWGIGNVLKKGTANLPAETAKYVATITADVPVT